MSVLTLADAKKHLNITTDAHDAELQDFIDAAESAIAEKCGPLTSVAKAERLKGGRAALALRHTPVVSLTSITPVGGSAYTLADFDVDESSGVVEWGSAAAFAPGRYDVAYQAGRTSVPDDLLMGIKELVRHTWSASQRGGPRRSGGGQTTDQAVSAGSVYLFIYKVQGYINPHVQVGN